MAWTTSGVFGNMLGSILGGEHVFALGYQYGTPVDGVANVALFDNTITPDKAAPYADAQYGAGAWDSGEKFIVTAWPEGGIAATAAGISYPNDPDLNVIMYDMDNTSSTTTLTLTDVYGALVYDDGTSQGICFNYFGGPNAVTTGTLTIVWNDNGLFRITV